MSLSVALSHPSSNPNSRWTALALQRAGALRAVYTSLDPRAWRVLRCFAGLAPYQRRVWPVEGHLLHQTLLPDLLGRAVSRWPYGGTRDASHELAYVLHDLLVSRLLRVDIDALYGYEDGCARSFRVARESGVVTMLELPAGHYREVQARSQAMVAQGRGPGFFAEPAWKLRRKEAELELSDVIVAPCPYVRDRAQAWLPEKRVVLGCYAMPVDELPAELRPCSGGARVVFVGALSHRKGVHELLRAWSDLGAGARGATLTLVGRATGGAVAGLMARSGSEGVFHVPAASRGEVGAILRRSDLLVLPSWCEGYGLVIGEALACGTPVLATRSTGAAGVIEHGRQGWLYEAEDYDALRTLLGEVIEEPARARELRCAARELAEAWAPERVLPHLAATLLQAIADRLGGAGGGQAP